MATDVRCPTLSNGCIGHRKFDFDHGIVQKFLTTTTTPGPVKNRGLLPPPPSLFSSPGFNNETLLVVILRNVPIILVKGGGTGGGGGGGGGRRAMAPQKFEWVGQGIFCPPPQILTTGPPPKWAASSQNLCQIASEHLKMYKIFKIFPLRQANMGRTYSTGDFMLFQRKFLYLVIFLALSPMT